MHYGSGHGCYSPNGLYSWHDANGYYMYKGVNMPEPDGHEAGSGSGGWTLPPGDAPSGGSMYLGSHPTGTMPDFCNDYVRQRFSTAGHDQTTTRPGGRGETSTSPGGRDDVDPVATVVGMVTLFGADKDVLCDLVNLAVDGGTWDALEEGLRLGTTATLGPLTCSGRRLVGRRMQDEEFAVHYEAFFGDIVSAREFASDVVSESTAETFKEEIYATFGVDVTVTFSIPELTVYTLAQVSGVPQCGFLLCAAFLPVSLSRCT
uniref:Uncharacterized protein n=1 Tax=Noctiluca scintillans TaxID=2966 RepID=A0A7S1AI32_NOCSC